MRILKGLKSNRQHIIGRLLLLARIGGRDTFTVRAYFRRTAE